MNNKHLITAIQLYNSISELISDPTIHITVLKKFPQIKDLPPDKLFWLETLEFIACISNADGNISRREINIMNYITGTYMEQEHIQKLLSSINDDNEDFLFKVPLTAKILYSVENASYKNDATTDVSDSIMNTLILFFKAIGLLVANADNNTTAFAFSRIDTYVNTIKEYVAENTLSPFFKY